MKNGWLISKLLLSPSSSTLPCSKKSRREKYWRLFTPCLLHNDIFHIFFNMIWLVVLGKQMEMRLSLFRYALFILIAAVVTNTAQYLMSGSNFIGFSGVLCAMLTFIWMRQKKTAWEGYQLRFNDALHALFYFYYCGHSGDFVCYGNFGEAPYRCIHRKHSPFDRLAHRPIFGAVKLFCVERHLT